MAVVAVVVVVGGGGGGSNSLSEDGVEPPGPPGLQNIEWYRYVQRKSERNLQATRAHGLGQRRLGRKPKDGLYELPLHTGMQPLHLGPGLGLWDPGPLPPELRDAELGEWLTEERVRQRHDQEFAKMAERHHLDNWELLEEQELEIWELDVSLSRAQDRLSDALRIQQMRWEEYVGTQDLEVALLAQSQRKGDYCSGPGEQGGTGPAHNYDGPEHNHNGPEHNHDGPEHSHDGPEQGVGVEAAAAAAAAAAANAAAAGQLRGLADRLASLSRTVGLALQQLPEESMRDLAIELENDWAVSQMDEMVRGVLASLQHGGSGKWVTGDRWRAGSCASSLAAV